jgi:hypothetical protein
MKTARRNTRGLLSIVAAIFLVTACATTKVTSDWKDPSYAGKPGKVLVLALLDDAGQRRLMEDELTGRMKSAGMDAIASYTVLPEAKPSDKEAVAAKVRELGADAVFTTRLVDRRTVQEYVPGTAYYPPAAYHNLYSYYDGVSRPYPPAYRGYPPGYGAGGVGPYPPAYSQGYTREAVYNIAEANMYDAVTGTLIWSARTESEMRGNDRKAINSYASEIMKSLEKQGLVK